MTDNDPLNRSNALRLTAYEARRLAERADAELPRARIGTQRDLIAAVEALADDVERLQQQYADAAHYQELYRSLCGDWNAMCAATEAAGIDVSNPMRLDAWQWTCPDGTTGTAETRGDATAAALKHLLGVE